MLNSLTLIGKSWKTHPEISRNFSFPGCDIDRYFTKTDTHKKLTDEFSRNPSMSHPGKLKFHKNFWMSFPRFANKG